MADDSELYWVWSNEHRAWWAAGKNGYRQRLAQAGVFSRAEAISICRQAIPGTAARMGLLPEIPVRVADVEDMVKGLKIIPEHLKR